jgi:hypothetical protein
MKHLQCGRNSMCYGMQRRIIPLVLAFSLCVISIAQADPLQQSEQEVPPESAAELTGRTSDFLSSLWQGMTEEANLRVGYGIIQWTMDVERSSDGATARMAQRDNEAIFVSYGSKPSFFQESSFGYTFMVNYTYFDMKNQMVSGTEFINYGTEVKGHLVYAVPTLFYQWGEHRYQGRFVRLGFGAGLGAAQFDGTVRLSTGEVVYAEKKTFEPRLALSNFLEARWNQFGISISYASPRVYGDGYDIRVSNLTANIGYVYYF